MTTDKMKRAVQFCEQWCAKFNGDINNYQEVSNFLGKYLKIAKEHAEQAIKMLGDELKYLFEPW